MNTHKKKNQPKNTAPTSQATRAPEPGTSPS